MITLIHGDNIAASRSYLIAEKQKTKDPISLPPDKITVTDLAQVMEGGELFSDTKKIFIEQFFTRLKKGKELDAIRAYVAAHATTHDVYLWEGKELTRTQIASFPTATQKVFKLPQTLFQFLDNIRPNNGSYLIQLFHQTRQTTEDELLFFMLIRHFRLLLATTSHASIDEIKRLAPWQQTKLAKQASLFKNNHLVSLYTRLHAIDVEQKTGSAAVPLSSTIDFFLLEI